MTSGNRLAVALAVVLFAAMGSRVSAGPASKEATQLVGSCGGMAHPNPPPPTPATTPSTAATSTSTAASTASSSSSSASSPSSPPSPSPSQAPVNFSCPFVDSLQNICDQNLNGTDQEVFQEWLIQIQITMYDLYCSGASDVQIFVSASLSLQVFLNENPSISEVISFLDLYDASGNVWAFVQDSCSVGVIIQAESIESCVTLSPSNDCSFFDAITQAGQDSGNSNVEDQCQQLISSCTDILQSSLNITYKLSFIYQTIQQQYPQLLPYLLSVNIQGFGSFASFLEVIQVEYQTVDMFFYLSGSNVGDCPILADFADLCNSCNGFDNITECFTLNQLYQQINQTIQATTDIELRQENISILIYNMCDLAPWVCGKQLGSCGCTIYQIQFISVFCHYFGTCDCGESQPPSKPTSGEKSGETATPGASGESNSGETGTPGPSGESNSGETETPQASPESNSGETGTPGPSGESNSEETEASSASTPSTTSSKPTTSGSTAKPTTTKATPTTKPTTTKATPTTKPTTTKPTTTPKPTTPTTPPPVCSSRGDCLVVVQPCNCSQFIISINITVVSWPKAIQTQFAPTFKCLKTAVYNNVLFPSSAKKINKIIACFNNWKGWQTKYHVQMYATIIQGWGWSVSSFIKCKTVPITG